MRNKTSRFIILIVSLIVFGNISMHGFSEKIYGGHQKIFANTAIRYQVPDTVPKFEIKEKPTAVEKSQKQANLLQRLGDVFKFRKFANNNEKSASSPYSINSTLAIPLRPRSKTWPSSINI